MEALTSWIRGHLAAAIVGGAAIVALLVALMAWNSTVNRGNGIQNRLNEQYPVTQNSLATCLLKIADAANLTKAEAATMNDALNDAVKGRYDGRSATPGSMFSAIVEDYPDLKVFDDAFKRAYHTIIGCRTDFQLAQNKLLGVVKELNDFKTTTLTGRVFGRGFPNENLQAGDARGAAALERMKSIVLTADTREAYRTGNLENSNPWVTPSS